MNDVSDVPLVDFILLRPRKESLWFTKYLPVSVMIYLFGKICTWRWTAPLKSGGWFIGKLFCVCTGKQLKNQKLLTIFYDLSSAHITIAD